MSAFSRLQWNCSLTAVTLLAAPAVSAQEVPSSPEPQRIARLETLMKQATCRVFYDRFSITGSLIREDLVITAAHLFEGLVFPHPAGAPDGSIQVLFPEPSDPAREPAKIPAALVLLNQDLDLAVLSIPPTGRTPLRIARGCSSGETIMAPSFKHRQPLILPLGKIVSVTEKNVVYAASAGSGSSGGPIVNLDGEIIGTCKGAVPGGPDKETGTTCETLRKWLAEMGGALSGIAR